MILPLDYLTQFSDSISELKRMYQLNVELLEQLAITCDFIKRNKIPVPNEETFNSLLNKTTTLIDEIQADELITLQYSVNRHNPSDDSYHEPRNRRKVNRTVRTTII
jgi:hypothetical protein